MAVCCCVWLCVVADYHVLLYVVVYVRVMWRLVVCVCVWLCVVVCSRVWQRLVVRDCGWVRSGVCVCMCIRVMPMCVRVHASVLISRLSLVRRLPLL